MATGTYNFTLRPESSPTSLAVYSLHIEKDNKFTYITQSLADTPEEYDWRSQWFSITGTTTIDGGKLKFTAESGKKQVKSSGWSGNGIEDTITLPTLEGEIVDNDTVIVKPFGHSVTLTRGPEMTAICGLVFPDYIFD